jgi:tetratricopeptide (TPR) repeat protein
MDPSRSRDATIGAVRRDRPRVRARTSESAFSGAGSSLALVPLSAALLVAALLLPRGVTPELVPLPHLDGRVIEREIRADAERADKARDLALSADVRALGSAIREFNSREARDAKELDLSDARSDIERARGVVLDHGKDEELLGLRAVQMQGFLAEVRRFERTGEVSGELEALGGTFVRRMRKVGWCQDHRLLLDDLERRAAFKQTWNTLIEVDKKPPFSLSTMETRALYTLYFTHPHAPEAQRSALAVARRAAKDKATLDRIADGEHAGAEAWLLTKLGEYGPLDPSYPLILARGVAYYQRRQYADAAHAFSEWLRVHPDGPWTLRARNYLRASSASEEASF